MAMPFIIILPEITMDIALALIFLATFELPFGHILESVESTTVDSTILRRRIGPDIVL
jgi:hypothetical protein